jgi:hypothetical protein
VGLDGTKIQANASPHSVLSENMPGKVEAQLKAEVAELLAPAKAAERQEARRLAPLHHLERPQPKDQINLTDEDSRITPVAGDGFALCYSAGGGGDRKPSGDRDGRGSGAQRQAADRTGAEEVDALLAGPKRCWPTTAISARRM